MKRAAQWKASAEQPPPGCQCLSSPIKQVVLLLPVAWVEKLDHSCLSAYRFTGTTMLLSNDGAQEEEVCEGESPTGEKSKLWVWISTTCYILTFSCHSITRFQGFISHHFSEYGQSMTSPQVRVRWVNCDSSTGHVHVTHTSYEGAVMTKLVSSEDWLHFDCHKSSWRKGRYWNYLVPLLFPWDAEFLRKLTPSVAKCVHAFLTSHLNKPHHCSNM